MEKAALIIHGIEGHAGIHWQGWLHDELVKRGYEVLMPNLPHSDHPERVEWLKTIKKEVKDVDFSDLIIVGHSLGVPTALDLIESEKKKVEALISVSGFSKDYGAKLNSYFLRERDIDFKAVNKLIGKAFVLYGDDDPYVPQEILKDLADNLRVEPIVIKAGGHLNTNSGYEKFSLLLELVKYG
jgi:predicted alpha/beta hydrolase family esterase